MLQLSNISKRYDDTLLLREVSFTLNAGERVGLVGPNGCGKTTLLRIIAGEVQADAGSVRRIPANVRLGYLPQGLTYAADEVLADVLQAERIALEAAEARVAELATAIATATGAEQQRLMDEYDAALADLELWAARQIPEHEAQAVLSGLGLGEVPLETPIAHLSGGQKTRLGLARLLLRLPQVLLLDEPTNHLDIAALEWLEDWIQDYRDAVLLVTHDRTFLERTVTTILELDPQTRTVASYPGSYDDYLTAKRREREKQMTAYRQQQEQIAQAKAEIGRLSGYARGIETSTIDFGPRAIAKGIARRATVQKRRLERELEEDRVEKPSLTWQMKLEFEHTPASGQEVIRLHEVAAGYEGAPLFREASAWLRQGERIALIGPNGCGKTTLLRVITGELAPMAGEVRIGANVKLGYYAQEQENLDPTSTPLATIRQVAAMSETDVRSFLHFFLFAGDDVFVPNGSLSYGERARLVLARLVATGCNCLILDEPINHLDIPSRANFERAMTAFAGTVLAVVHDRYFIKQFASRIWALEAGTLRTYVDLPDYQRHRSAQSITFPEADNGL